MFEYLSLRRRAETANGAAGEPALSLLYVEGSSPNLDQEAIDQLERLPASTRVVRVPGVDAALAEIRGATAGNLVTLLTSPSLSDDEVLGLMEQVRQEEASVAVVALAEANRARRFLKAGLDAVLVMRDRKLVNPVEALRSAGLKAQPEASHDADEEFEGENRGARWNKLTRKLPNLLSDWTTHWWSSDDLEMDNLAEPEVPTSPEDRQLIQERLNAALRFVLDL